ARADAIGDGAEPEVDARRLQLRFDDVFRGDDLAPGANQAAQDMARQDSPRVAPPGVGLCARAQNIFGGLGPRGLGHCVFALSPTTFLSPLVSWPANAGHPGEDGNCRRILKLSL